MNKLPKKWKILSHQKNNSRLDISQIIKILLKNRGLTTSEQMKEFISPPHPKDLTLKQLGINKKEVNKTTSRIKKALKDKEEVIIYGDYDADGICATAIIWEGLYSLGLSVMPYIPDRFTEGYGIKAKSVEELKLKSKNLKLIITVDNGIVATDEIKKVNKLGIDVIVCDHHTYGKTIPPAYSIIHTTKICGAAIAWILAREIVGISKVQNSLGLAGIGTVADQMPLIGANRSLVKYGIEELRETQRDGFLSMFQEAGIEKEKIGTYEINYLIAPRINAMGRLQHSIESLQLVCTKNRVRAHKLAVHLGKVNRERQKIVDETVLHAKNILAKAKDEKILILADKSYHEGVVGLAASRLVEEFYRPAIVISQGKEFSKASARSVRGFDIIGVIRKLSDILEEYGGHPMAAGFSLKTSKINDFKRKMTALSKPLLSEEILSPKLFVDLSLSFKDVTRSLATALKKFEPNGIGNPQPTFVSEKVKVVESRLVGRDGKHLKLALNKNGVTLEAIAFGQAEFLGQISRDVLVDIVYMVEENVWGGYTSLQLKIKDIKLSQDC